MGVAALRRARERRARAGKRKAAAGNARRGLSTQDYASNSEAQIALDLGELFRRTLDLWTLEPLAGRECPPDAGEADHDEHRYRRVVEGRDSVARSCLRQHQHDDNEDDPDDREPADQRAELAQHPGTGFEGTRVDAAQEYGRQVGDIEADDRDGGHGVVGDGVVHVRKGKDERPDGAEPGGTNRDADALADVVPEVGEGHGAVAYYAVTSIAVIGLYIAYLTPVFLRRINPSAFKPGPWVLGKFGPLIGWLAIVWVIFIVIVLMLPQAAPGNTVATFNYAPVAVLVVVGFAGIWWALSARKWFKGPKIQGSSEELAEIERDLSL